MTCDLLVKNVRCWNRSANAFESVNLAVKDGRVAAVLPRSHGDEVSAKTVVEGAGRCALPGFIDLHVHLRDPGYTYKEDILSGCRAAAAGGVTSVFCMPNTKPVCDSAEVLSYILDKAKSADARVFPVAAITEGMLSEKVCDLTALRDAGAAAFSDDGKPVMTAALLREAMKIAAENDLLIMSHCEDMSLAKGGAINEGMIARKLGLKGIPNLAEDLCIERDIMLAEETGARLHICHVSTKGGLACIRRAKERGVRVTAETCPHYFSLTESDVIFYGANAKMNPPLRTRDDLEAVIEAIRDGTIDAISTDHAPHSAEEKGNDLAKALNGIIGMQTSFAVSYTNLVQAGHITLSRLIELMSYNPAKITGLDKLGLGMLEAGSAADFSLVTLGCEDTISPDELAGKSANTPFAGMTFSARIDATFMGGRQVYANKKYH
ncbi:MAG: dihydroorotase [Clostridia bacterium]|nr:dihydroorotase [Clostridia bacterium]